MQNIVNCNFKIDKIVKNKFDVLCNEFGLTMSAVINMFIRQSINTNALSIDLSRRLKEKEELLRKINNAYRLRAQTIKLYADEEIKKIWASHKKEGRKP